jgi:carbonic anhydrase
MKALLEPEELIHAQATGRWLRYAKPAVGVLNARYPEAQGKERLEHLSKLNVLTQIANLHTHPLVESRLAEGRLELHGWYYDIPTGRVDAYNVKTGQFDELI